MRVVAQIRRPPQDRRDPTDPEDPIMLYDVRIAREDPRPLASIAAGAGVAYSTLYGWCRHGVVDLDGQRHRLAVIRRGGRLLSSVPALQRWHVALLGLDEADVPALAVPSHAEAEAELREAGA